MRITQDCNACPEVRGYFDFVRQNPDMVCKEQVQFVQLVERAFKFESLYIDLDQLEKYMANQRYFPYNLFAWEKCVFALHNCTYREGTRDPRWPTLQIFVGRGTGKNGYLAFEDFCLLTPTCGIPKYNIDIYATCEDQAAQTFKDVYDILESRADFFKNYFYWNKTLIRNLKTKSELAFHTRAPNSKDGKRPGKNDYDEVHAYENYALIDTTQTGLGKVPQPKETFISSNGDKRDGPFDDYVADGEDILNGVVPDNGTLPFFCWVESDEEIHNEKCWHKANPSLHEFPELLKQIRKEYNNYKKEPYKHHSFASKRMNRPNQSSESSICEWDDLLAASRDFQENSGSGKLDAVIGIDFTLINDFASAGFLSKPEENAYQWESHSWVCKNSADLYRIKYDLEAAEKQGLLTIVDDVEISPELITEWIAEHMGGYNVKGVCMDTYRYSVLKRALENIGFIAGKGGNIFLTRPSDLEKAAPQIIRVLTKHFLAWGKNNTLMRWYCWNVKKVMKKDNVSFEKQDYKKRKTDGFYAMAHAFTKIDELVKPKRRKSIPRVPVIRLN